MQALQLMRRHLNTEPQRVALAYTVDAIWPNRAEFPVGRAQVQAFRERKWAHELDLQTRRSTL